MKKTYEEYTEELNSILKNFDENKYTLEEMLKNYEKALDIIKKLETLLNEAEGKIQLINSKME